MSADPIAIRCAGCGAIHDSALEACPHCGTPASDSRAFWQDHRPPTDKPVPIWMIAAGALIWAAIGIAIWLGSHG